MPQPTHSSTKTSLPSSLATATSTTTTATTAAAAATPSPPPPPKETLLYPADNESNHSENINDYDAVLFTVCDVFGRPRGKFAVKDGITSFVKSGVPMPKNTTVLGFNSEVPTKLARYNERTDAQTTGGRRNYTQSSYFMRPDVSTLRPLSWLSTEKRKVGHVLCNLKDAHDLHDPCSPRDLALTQLSALRELGYQIMSAVETEYIMFKKGTLEPAGGNYTQVMNLFHVDLTMDFLYDHTLDMIASGLPVETLMEEYGPGQVEFSMKPQYGIKMADSIHRQRYVAKALCERDGLDCSFMSKPLTDQVGNGYHFNHSLWTLDGKNAFYNPEEDHNCSDLMYHWIAGLMKHGNGLTALTNPTVNCYRRLCGFFAPGDNVWNYDDRNARLRVKTKDKNVYLEERTPSSACNPYLCLAGIVAAGLDGIINKLECPPPKDFRPIAPGDPRSKPINPFPKTLEGALKALEEDDVLVKALGEDFVKDYVALCSEFQVDKLKMYEGKDAKEQMEAEQRLYMYTL